jgi:acetyl-CoA carboxylase carboxyltransferase component/biotin carboxyl carrier protein
MFSAATHLGKHIKYNSVGTIEFLVDRNFTTFYFMECNPRLQIEHPVTEMRYSGLDLVLLKFHLACFPGTTLDSLRKKGLLHTSEPTGFSLEVRINMESILPDGSVIPRASGTLTKFQFRPYFGARVETAAHVGWKASDKYDNLLAKVIVYSSQSFQDLLAKMRRLLQEFVIEGITTNKNFILRVLEHPEFSSGNATTAFLRIFAKLLVPSSPDSSSSSSPSSSDPNSCFSPLKGVVSSLLVKPGMTVRKNQPVVVISSMKMEHEIRSQVNGLVNLVLVAEKDLIQEGQLLFSIQSSSLEDSNTEAEIRTLSSSAPTDISRSDPMEREDYRRFRELESFTSDNARIEAVRKRHAITKMQTVNENLAMLLDQDSPFLEYGKLATRMGALKDRDDGGLEEARRAFPRDGVLCGIGRVHGVECAIVIYDYLTAAGTQGHTGHAKQDRLFSVAFKMGLPLILFAEGGGGRPEFVNTTAGLDVPTFKMLADLAGKVPTIAIVEGRCFAGNAVLAGTCDVILATRNASIGIGGPAMIAGAGLANCRPEDVGPAAMHEKTGAIDLLVENEKEAIGVARSYLNLVANRFPFSSHAGTSIPPAPDQTLLRSIIPENRRRSYDIRAVISTLCDTESVLELRPRFGTSMVTSFARVQGYSVGVIANVNTHPYAGAIDADGAEKQANFMELCNTYGIPVLMLCDTPGFMVGVEIERTNMIRKAPKLFRVASKMNVPVMTIVLRKMYGLGAMAMCAGGTKSNHFTVSYPTGEMGAMGFEGAITLGFRKTLDAISDLKERAALFDKLVQVAYERGKVMEAASQFELDEVIDPADSRKWITTILASFQRNNPKTSRL